VGIDNGDDQPAAGSPADLLEVRVSRTVVADGRARTRDYVLVRTVNHIHRGVDFACARREAS
jgi:hypothetical protein